MRIFPKGRVGGKPCEPRTAAEMKKHGFEVISRMMGKGNGRTFIFFRGFFQKCIADTSCGFFQRRTAREGKHVGTLANERDIMRRAKSATKCFVALRFIAS